MKPIEMTHEQQRIVIAKWAGTNDHAWSKSPSGCSQCSRCCLMIGEQGASDPCVLAEPPDYLNDLNAIVKVASGLVGGGQGRYSDNLMRVIQDRRCVTSALTARYLTAVAEAGEHAEAFLRTIGKWNHDTKS